MVVVRAVLGRWDTGVYSRRCSLIRRDDCGTLRIPEKRKAALQEWEIHQDVRSGGGVGLGGLPELVQGVILFRDSGPEIRIKKEFSHEPLEALSFWKLGHAGSIVLMVCCAVAAMGQGIASSPIKPGLWQSAGDLVDADGFATGGAGKDCGDAGGAAGADAGHDGRRHGAAKPASTTVKSCVASAMTPTDLLNQAQQKAG